MWNYFGCITVAMAITVAADKIVAALDHQECQQKTATSVESRNGPR